MEKKGMITGIVVLGAGLSAFVMAPLINLLVGYGMRNTFLILGILLLTGMTFLARMIKNPPADPVPADPDPADRAAILQGEPAWYNIFYSSQYYLLWLMFWVTTGIGVTFVTHLDSISRVHAAFERGYILVALFAFFNAAGRIIAGLLSDRLGRSRAMTLDFSVTLIALLFLMQAGSPLYMGVAISILGLAYGGLYTLFPAAVAAYFGDKNFGLIYGLVYTGLGFAGVFPLLAGYLYGRQGDFHGVFVLLVVACCTVIFLSLLLKQPVAKKSELMEVVKIQ
jgi:OFA family oxalate/formate antiporter-like MFS transporter